MKFTTQQLTKTRTKVIWLKAELLLVCIRQVAAEDF